MVDCSDFIVYGANLSFTNLEDTSLYVFKCKRHRAIKVVYRVDGVGSGGSNCRRQWIYGREVGFNGVVRKEGRRSWRRWWMTRRERDMRESIREEVRGRERGEKERGR